MTTDQDLAQGGPQAARMYDYLLGGKDNYPADWEAANKVLETFPTARTAAHVNRAFMHRAARFLVGEVGIRQFLDIGTGIPTEPNLHQVAQAVAPECRVVYVDNDPIVRVHAQALIVSTPEGRTTFLEADVREPDAILDSPELTETLDLSQPVALSLIALLHFIPDHRDPYGIVDRLLSALPSGSALVISHGTKDLDPEGVGKIEETYGERGIEMQLRSRQEVGRFFTGFELVEPGIELLHHWRPDGNEEAAQINDADISAWCGVAIKH